MKSFVTLFHLGFKKDFISRDVGYIPYYLNKLGYKSSIVTPYIGDDYDKYGGVSIEAIKGKTFHFHKSFELHTGLLRYLFKNAKNIDILNVYHFSLTSLFYAYIYRSLNKKGTLYRKLDYDNSIFKKNNHFYIYNKYTNWIYKFFENLFITLFDIISIESEEGFELLLNYNKRLKGKLFFLPNGVDDINIKQDITNEKMNQIITVGRIGTYQKNSEMLLEVLSKLTDDLINYKWNVKIVGPYDDKFAEKIDKFFKRNPKLKDVVQFTGAVSKNGVYEIYKKSKIFCLTSVYEGFPNVFPEAIYFGNMIITTDVSGSKDITDNGRLGYVVNQGDTERYIQVLRSIIHNEQIYRDKYNDILEYSNHYKWSSIIKNLHEKLSLIQK